MLTKLVVQNEEKCMLVKEFLFHSTEGPCYPRLTRILGLGKTVLHEIREGPRFTHIL